MNNFINKLKIKREIKYIEKFITGKCPCNKTKVYSDDMIKTIKEYLEKNTKYSYFETTSILNGLYYHNNTRNYNKEINTAERRK
jgi:hypothetical protein